MPESVTDRPTKSHEYVFLLSKSEKYFYDADAIKEPSVKGDAGAGARNYVGTQGRQRLSQTETDRNEGRNKRTVWSIATKPYSGAHFAVMPPKLVEICILAGSSPQACEYCGSPWKRVMEITPMVIRKGPRAGKYGSNTTDGLTGTMLVPSETRTVGWESTCSCPNNTGSGHCVILDPFCGAGTTPLVALQYGRDYLGIELNPEYIDLAKKRIAVVQPTLWKGGVA
jgi:hypothetical protein